MDLGWFDSSRSTDELSPPVCSRSELPWGHQETGPGQTHGQAAFSSRNASKNVFFGYRLGSLEVELPTIWTDGKAEVGRVHVYYICIYIYTIIYIYVVYLLYICCTMLYPVHCYFNQFQWDNGWTSGFLVRSTATAVHRTWGCQSPGFAQEIRFCIRCSYATVDHFAVRFSKSHLAIHLRTS